MLFNPEWDNFKNFVARQPANEHYPYSNSHDCACARWLKSEKRFTPEWLADDKNKEFNRLAGGDAGFIYGMSWTFGQLLDRINAREKELA